MKPPRSPTQRLPTRGLLARGLLALLLLFAQQTASLHWLSHAIDATHAKAAKSSAPSDHCDECLALGALAAGATSSAAAIAPPMGEAVWNAPHPGAAPTLELRLAFRSRAPPVPV